MLSEAQITQHRDEVLQACYLDTGLFSKTFFPGRFSKPFNELHKEILELVDARDYFGRPLYQKIAIAAPRGIGKSSLFDLAYACKGAYYRDHDFIVIASSTETVATMHSENLKREVVSNQFLKEAFGNPRSKGRDGIDEAFSKESWVISLPRYDDDPVPYRGTMIFPRGSGQQVRGMLFGDARPSLMLFDDLEDRKTIDNEEIRRERKNWFYDDALRCVSQYERNWQIIYIDTLKHHDALLAELLESSDWKSIRLSICTPDYKSLAPSFISDEEIARQVALARENGTLDGFGREMMNVPIIGEAASFHKELFKYYDETEEQLNNMFEYENVVLVDPAKTVNLKSDRSAIVCWAIKSCGGYIERLLLRDVKSGLFEPDQLYDEAISMAERCNAKVIGVEETGLNEFIKHPFQTALDLRGAFAELVWLKARKGQNEYAASGRGKEGRIAQLVPYYKKDLIRHNKQKCSAYEQQLLSFPKSRFWDIMDAAAYIVEMLEQGNRYFKPSQVLYTVASRVAGRGRDENEAEFEELKKMDLPPLDYDVMEMEA